MASGGVLHYAQYAAGPGHARPGAEPRDAKRQAQLLLLLAATVVFIVSAGALLLPSVAASASHTVAPTNSVSAVWTSRNTAAPAPLSAPDLEYVLAHAAGMQADDSLVQVRPGVYAKHSNVSGLTVNGRTVYYDVAPHQSFGPLRSGQWAESDVDILNRTTVGATQVVVYAPKR